ncbi:MAG: hypothetical protein IJY06_09465 [Oscillospiraceae bacterium]|nr:hypothetical protein [Oscillospiraceae bacterium]
MRGIQYYRANNVSLDDRTVLISGQCAQIKALYLAEQLKQAARRGYKTVVIDFGRTGNFSSILDSCGFHSQHAFVAGRDNYASSETPICEAISNLRTHACKMGYEHSTYAHMTAFLSFLMSLDSGNCHSIQQLLRKFSNQEKLEETLHTLVKSGAITVQDAEDKIQTYLEYAASGIIADTLLTELDFIMKPNIGAEAFSLSDLKQGEAAVLYASENNSTDLNDYMVRLWTSDLIQMAAREPILIVINAGHHPQIDRMYELIESTSTKTNVSIFYSSYDLFSGVDAKRAIAFAKIFRYNIYGSHSNESAEVISSMFPEHWLTQFNYADDHNQRIMGESLIDKILGTDHTMTVSTSLVKETIIPAYSIVGLTEYEFIIFDTLTNEVQSASI